MSFLDTLFGQSGASANLAPPPGGPSDYAALNPDAGNTAALEKLLAPDPYAEFDKKRREEAEKQAAMGVFGSGAALVPAAGISGLVAQGAGGQGTPFSLAPQRPGVPPSLAMAQSMTAPPPQPPQGAPMPPPGAAPPPAPSPAMPPQANEEDTPPNAAPTQGRGPAPMGIAGPLPAPTPEPSFMDRLSSGMKSISPALLGVGAALQGDMGATTRSMLKEQQALAEQTQTQNLTAKALLAKGVDPTTVAAAVRQPELLKALVGEHFGKSKYKVQQTREDALGGKTFEAINENDPTDRIKLGPSDSAASGIGDMSKTGAEYLATVPPKQAGVLQGMIDGTIQPPSSFAMAKPYWRTMVAAAKNLDPAFDENTWAGRHKMTVDMAASGNSSMGGILSNGKSAFKHLAEYTDSAADLGNASHDFPLGGKLANTQNYLGNTLGGSNTKAKIKAINDNLGHYGQESTKFYAGTGGGVEERMNALKEMNPISTSSEEMASYAEKEKHLMLDRLGEKEAQIRQTMGDAYLKKNPVFTPDLQRNIDRIDANIAKLRGGSPPAAAPAQIASKAQYDALSAGSAYIAPDGSHRIKK